MFFFFNTFSNIDKKLIYTLRKYNLDLLVQSRAVWLVARSLL